MRNVFQEFAHFVHDEQHAADALVGQGGERAERAGLPATSFRAGSLGCFENCLLRIGATPYDRNDDPVFLRSSR